MDTVTAQRSAHGINVSAVEYIAAQQRRQQLSDKAVASFDNLDCWLSPTCPFVPIALADIESGKLHDRALPASRNTQPGNMLGLCAMSLPMHQSGLPTGLQIMMPANQDKALLEVSYAIDKIINQAISEAG